MRNNDHGWRLPTDVAALKVSVSFVDGRRKSDTFFFRVVVKTSWDGKQTVSFEFFFFFQEIWERKQTNSWDFLNVNHDGSTAILLLHDIFRKWTRRDEHSKQKNLIDIYRWMFHAHTTNWSVGMTKGEWTSKGSSFIFSEGQNKVKKKKGSLYTDCTVCATAIEFTRRMRAVTISKPFFIFYLPFSIFCFVDGHQTWCQGKVGDICTYVASFLGILYYWVLLAATTKLLKKK